MKAPCCECCITSCDLCQGKIELLKDDCSVCGGPCQIEESMNNTSKIDKVKSDYIDNRDVNGNCEENHCLYDVKIWLKILQSKEEPELFDDASSVHSVEEYKPAVIKNPLEPPTKKALKYERFSNLSIRGPLPASSPTASTSSSGNASTKLYTLF